jgi:hypothetical protein
MKMTVYFDLFDANNRFVLRAELRTIAAVLNLHEEAVQRIETETKNDSICTVYRNTRDNSFFASLGDRVFVRLGDGAVDWSKSFSVWT